VIEARLRTAARSNRFSKPEKQDSPDATTKEKVAEIAADFMTTF
jgi:hypothetical protein